MKRMPVLILALLATVSMSSQAAVVTLDQGRPYSAGYNNGGMGAGRGLGFQANETFSMTGLGIDLNVFTAQQNFQFKVFGSTNGRDTGALLGEVSFNLNAGTGYQMQSLNFDFVKGNYYVINFAKADGSGLGNLGTKYSWEDPGSFVPHDYGVLTVIEGFEGTPPQAYNALLPHMRLEIDTAGTVPEPGSLALIAAGVVGFGALRKRVASKSHG